jgi:hypothetical protein
MIFDIEGCDYGLVEQATAEAQVRPAEITQLPGAGLREQSPDGMMTWDH